MQKENERRAERMKDIVLQLLVSSPYSRAFELANESGASRYFSFLVQFSFLDFLILIFHCFFYTPVR